MELILASGSKRRADLLGNCGYRFEVIKSDADESLIDEKDPAGLVQALSLLKARSVFDSLDEDRKRGAVVLGSDTVVALGGEVLGKPENEEDAFRMLKKESGAVNTVHTGVAVVRYEDGEVRETVCHDAARVTFADLSDEEIRAYIATGEPMDKAGAYGIQGSFSMFIDRVEGNYFTVVGLPVNKAYRLLKEAGILPAAFEK